MGPDPTDDPSDKDYDVSDTRRGVWTVNYLRKFTKLLLDNTVVLQSLQGHSRDDPIHQLRKGAMEHMREQLGMATTDQLKARINAFKKLAADKMRQYKARSPQCKPETILKSVPRWMRDLEPHLNLCAQIMPRKVKNQKTIIEPTPQGKVRADCYAGPGRSTGLALALVQKARELRSLDARTVCQRLDSVPAQKREALQYVWWRMLDVVRQKLNLHRDAGDFAYHMHGARFSLAESLLADLVLLLDDTICTVSESGDYETVQVLVALFHLAQLHRLEESDVTQESWRAAHRAFRARFMKMKGVCSSVILMQRRWHELKVATRRALAEYTRRDKPRTAPSPLYTAIAKRFPHIVTARLPTWRELVNSGAVIENDDESGSDDPQWVPPLPPDDVSGINMVSTKELMDYQRSAKDDEDDLVLIEKEIETIDLIDLSEEHVGGAKRPIQDYAFDDQMQQKLKTRRQNFAQQLEKELDRQLKDFEKQDGVSEMTLLEEPRPAGAPRFIYDSDSDIECSEDRNRNIEMIASQIGDEENVDQIAFKIKKEIIDEVVSSDSDEPAADLTGDDDRCGDGMQDDDDDCVAIDEKLVMDTRITLVKIDETPQWKHAKRASSIDVTKLDPALWQPKRAKPDVESAARELVTEISHEASLITQAIKIKVEKDTESADNPKGERHVKSMARRLISEMMRDECDSSGTASRSRACARKVRELMDTDESSNRVAKKVQLPNIEDVRKNNSNLLTAQVAPLTTDGAEGERGVQGAVPTEEMDEDFTLRLSIDSTDGLCIDEGQASGEGDDITLSKDQLDSVLERLANDRVVESGTSEWKPAASTAHCCTLQRQRALNAARRRVAARAGRLPPAPVDLHTTSLCGRGKRCMCCCKHLLSEADAGAKLLKEAREIDAALRRLMKEDWTEATDENESCDNGNANKKTTGISTDKTTGISTDKTTGISTDKTGTGIKKPKKKKDEIVPVTNEEESDPLQEWIRQKTLNQKYFNLNLKTKPRAEEQAVTDLKTKPQAEEQAATDLQTKPLLPVMTETQSETEKPFNATNTNAIPKIVYIQKNIQKGTKLSSNPATNLMQNANNSQNEYIPTTVISGPSTTFQKVQPKLPTTLKITEARTKLTSVLNQTKTPTTSIIGPGTKVSTSVFKQVKMPALIPNVSVPFSNSQISFNKLKTIPPPVNVIRAPLKAQPGTLIKLTIPTSSNQVGPVHQSLEIGRKVPPLTVMSVKSGPAKSVSLSNVIPVITKQSSQQDFMETHPHLSKLLKIAPKPASASPESAQANQANQARPGQANQTSLAMEGTIVNQATSTKIIVGRNQSVQQSIEILRTADMKLIKKSSSSSPSLPVLSEPRSLLKPSQTSPQKTKRIVIISKDGTKNKEITLALEEEQGASTSRPVFGMVRSNSSTQAQRVINTLTYDQRVINTLSCDRTFASPLLGGGAMLTNLTRVNNTSSAGLAPANGTFAVSPVQQNPVQHDIEKHFKRKDNNLRMDEFLKGKDPTKLELQCFDDSSPVLTLLDSYYILTETDLSFSAPSYWPICAVPAAARLIMEDKKSVVSVKSGSKSNAEVMASPDKMYLDNKAYVKLKDEPLLYAKMLCAVRSTAECHRELVRSASLYFVHARSGALSTLARDLSLGPDTLALTSPYLEAAKALANLLNQLSSQPKPEAAPARCDVNARANVVMMINNVKRQPIEMVYIDSDEECSVKKEDYNFNGLENFEDLDDFDL